MSFLEYHMILEARKNPELNPKVPAIKIIQQCAEEADNPWEQYTDDVSNCFVSFTALDKLGINPTSQYDTPNALYSYSAKSFEFKTVARDVPFAGSKPFINIFKAKNPQRVVVLNMMSNKQFQMLCDKTREYYVNTKINKGLAKVKKTSLSQADHDYIWKKFSDEFESIINASERRAYNTSYGGRWWYITMTCANELANPVNPDQPVNAKGHSATQGAPNAWNKLFRGIGVDGCIDTGEGIIHSAEKQQSFFVGADVIEMIVRIDNKEYEKRPLPRENRQSIARSMAKAAQEGNPNKIVNIVSSVAVIEDDPYTTKNIISGLNLSALNVLCSGIEHIMGNHLDDSSIDRLKTIVSHIAILVKSTRMYDPTKLGKDGTDDVYYELGGSIRGKLHNLMTFWPLMPLVKSIYDKADVRSSLRNLSHFANEFTNKPVDYLVEVIHFCHEAGWDWWTDDYFSGVVDIWDKENPNTDDQVGVWSKAESWGYVK